MATQVSMNRAGKAPTTGQQKPSELLEYCLKRIEEREGDIRAWAYIDAQGARAAAAQLDQELLQGKSRGPLHGMPIGIKDIVDVVGMPTRAGSSLTSDKPAQRDAPAVRRLRDAGAIILGKTITTEWACFDPPPTRNPWDFAHTPGGSSSGSAAAVSVQMCLAAVASQTGGSIIRPGSYCGVCSCKPTYGAISLENVFPLSPELDHLGAMARTIDELTPVVMAMIGDANGSVSAQRARQEAPSLGIIEEFFLEEADTDIINATRAAVQRLRDAGATIRTIPLPESFANIHASHRAIMIYQAARYHHEQFTAHANQYGPCISSVLLEGARVTDEEFHAAVAHQRRFQKDLPALMAGVDALLVPATTGAAPPAATTGDLRFNSPWTFSWLPVVAFPVALDGRGLPLAVQIIGAANQDQQLLSVAKWCESVLPFESTPRNF